MLAPMYLQSAFIYGFLLPGTLKLYETIFLET